MELMINDKSDFQIHEKKLQISSCYISVSTQEYY